MELHNWIMEPHNLGALSPSALHIIQQNINLTLFPKNIYPRLLFLDFVFNLYLSNFIFGTITRGHFWWAEQSVLKA